MIGLLRKAGSAIAARYRRLEHSTKAGITTAWIAAVSVFGVSVLGFLADVQQWAGTEGAHFPSVNPIGKAAASLVVAGVAGTLNVLFRKVKPGPTYTRFSPEERAAAVDRAIQNSNGFYVSTIDETHPPAWSPIPPGAPSTGTTSTSSTTSTTTPSKED